MCNNFFRILTFILIFLLPNPVFCQIIFLVDGFSKEYHGKLFIADTTQVFSKGWVAIYNTKTKKEIIKVEADELTSTLRKGRVIANIQELPYGEQSQIMYDDYNFDGVKDFAIMNGQLSCYHLPSFEIYLAEKKGFKKSKEFSMLSSEYCGMFRVNNLTKTLHTSTKSGCCWHQESDFKVKNNIPYAIKIVEETTSVGLTFDYTEQNLVNDKMVKTAYKKLALEVNKDSIMLSFELENKNKIQVFQNSGSLFCVMTDNNDKIEVLYYDDLNYTRRENALSFIDKEKQYTIYDNKILIKAGKDAKSINATENKKFGTLSKLENIKASNLKID